MASRSEDYEAILSQRPALKELLEHVATTKWYNLGLALELKSQELDEIEQNFPYVDSRRRKMFNLWLEVKAEGTRRDIIAALGSEIVQENAMAKKYMDYLKSIIATDANLSLRPGLLLCISQIKHGINFIFLK